MSHPHGHTHHPGLPILQLHASHIGWHSIDHPLRATLIVASSLVGLALLGLTGRELPVVPSPSSLLPASRVAATQAARGPAPELPREWRYEVEAVDVGYMYGEHAGAPSVDQMYRTRY